MTPKNRVIALRLAQTSLGVALYFLLVRVLMKQFDGQAKLIFAVIAALLFGYLAVWSNLLIDKSTEPMAYLRVLKPNKFGHLAMFLGSLAIGFGLYSKSPVFTLVGGCLFFLANYWLTRIQESPILKVWEEVGREHEKRQIKDLAITICAEVDSKNGCKLTVKNTGKTAFTKLHILYEPLLLDAESYGLDTTHMPSKDARIDGDPIQIELLLPSQSVHFSRKGWGDSNRFEGLRKSVVSVTLETPISEIDPGKQRWCYAVVDLPNAKR